MNIDDTCLYYDARKGNEIRQGRPAKVTRVYPRKEMQAFSPGTWIANAVNLDLMTEDGVLHENVPSDREAGARGDDGEYWQERSAS